MDYNPSMIIKSGSVADLKKLANMIHSSHVSIEPTEFINISLRLLKEISKKRASSKIIYYLLEILLALKFKEASNLVLGQIQACLDDVEKSNLHALDLRNLTRAYIRLERENLHDLKPIFELFKYNNINVTEACLEVIGYDRMLPSDHEITFLIHKFWDCMSPSPSNTCDTRYGLVAACAGWKPELVDDFLQYCLVTGDPPVKFVAEAALNRKYVKLRSIAYF
jgi:hypothetical protein